MQIQKLSRAEFVRQYYVEHDSLMIENPFCGHDDMEVLSLLIKRFRPKRLLEIGTASGITTANFTEWTDNDATIFSIGVHSGIFKDSTPQVIEIPTEEEFGREINWFRKEHKVKLIAADSTTYDFAQIAPIDFAFIDGGHTDMVVASDTWNVFHIIAKGGVIAWHDLGNYEGAGWCGVRRVVEELHMPEIVYEVEGTLLGFTIKL